MSIWVPGLRAVKNHKPPMTATIRMAAPLPSAQSRWWVAQFSADIPSSFGAPAKPRPLPQVSLSRARPLLRHRDHGPASPKPFRQWCRRSPPVIAVSEAVGAALTTDGAVAAPPCSEPKGGGYLHQRLEAGERQARTARSQLGQLV